MNDSETQLKAVLPLLQEYTAKLEELDFHDSSDQIYFQNLQPPARKLAQFVSQKMNGVKDDALRLELELRLAEFEAALKLVNTPNGRRRRVPSGR